MQPSRAPDTREGQEVLRLCAPVLLPTLNEYTRTCRGRALAGASQKKRAEKSLAPYVAMLQPIEIPAGYALHIATVWTRPNRRSDPDNISFAKKFILDALVSGGVIPGDGPRYIASFEDHFALGDAGIVMTGTLTKTK